MALRLIQVIQKIRRKNFIEFKERCVSSIKQIEEMDDVNTSSLTLEFLFCSSILYCRSPLPLFTPARVRMP